MTDRPTQDEMQRVIIDTQLNGRKRRYKNPTLTKLHEEVLVLVEEKKEIAIPPDLP